MLLFAGYPTIKYFSHLKITRDYNGGRTEADFIKFLNSPTDTIELESSKIEPFGDFPGVEEVLMLGDKDFDDKIKDLDGVLVMFFAPW